MNTANASHMKLPVLEFDDNSLVAAKATLTDESKIKKKKKMIFFIQITSSFSLQGSIL